MPLVEVAASAARAMKETTPMVMKLRFSTSSVKAARSSCRSMIT